MNNLDHNVIQTLEFLASFYKYEGFTFKCGGEKFSRLTCLRANKHSLLSERNAFKSST